MRISGVGNFLPPHVARAYGVPAPVPASPAAPAPNLHLANPAHALSANSPVAAPATALRPEAHGLVAGHVPGGVNFDGASVPRAQGVYHLYTRAADKIEAATAIQIGRAIDVKG